MMQLHHRMTRVKRSCPTACASLTLCRSHQVGHRHRDFEVGLLPPKLVGPEVSPLHRLHRCDGGHAQPALPPALVQAVVALMGGGGVGVGERCERPALLSVQQESRFHSPLAKAPTNQPTHHQPTNQPTNQYVHTIDPIQAVRPCTHSPSAPPSAPHSALAPSAAGTHRRSRAQTHAQTRTRCCLLRVAVGASDYRGEPSACRQRGGAAWG